MAQITVTNLNDAGAGSLRQALLGAGAGDVITFASNLSGGVLRLTTGQLYANVALTIDGDIDNDGKPDITITGDKNGDDVNVAGSTLITDVAASLAANKLSDNSQILYSTASLAIDGVVLTGGNSSVVSGSGVLNESGTLSIGHSIIAGNRSSTGGGIATRGDLTMSDSVVYGNVATDLVAGALVQGSASLTNVTMYGNTSAGAWGGVYAFGNLTVTHSTFTGNQGNGIVAAPTGRLVLTNSILLGDAGAELSASGVTYQGVNIVGIGSDTNTVDGRINAASLESVFALVGANPLNGVTSGLMVYNGGTLPSVALRPYSGNPAIDRADDGLSPSTDGRGFARYDVPAFGSVADLGAFEAQNVGVPVNTVPPGIVVSEDSAIPLFSLFSVAQANGLALTVKLSVGHGSIEFVSLSNLTVTGGANGTGTISVRGAIADLNNALNSLSYRPSANYNGSDTLTMETTDGRAGDVDTVAINISGVNDAPIVSVAIPDQSVAEDAPWSFQVPAGIFTDVDGETLTYSASLGNGAPLPSWLAFDPVTRTFSGTPPANFNGPVDLKVTAADGSQLAASDVFTLTVTPVDDAPVVAAAIADQSVNEDTPWSFQVPAGSFTDVDGQTLTYSATLGDGSTLPSWLTFDPATRTFSGTPPQDFNGAIDLKVTASDGSLSASDTFSLNVLPVNDAPTTSPVTLLPAASEDGSRVISAAELLANAADIDGDTLTVSGLTAASGMLVDNGNGTWTLTPAANDDTSVTFTYTVSDGHGGSAAGSATLDLLPVNDTPMAVNDTVAAVEGETPVGNVLTNDSDIDVGDSLAVIGILGGTVGQELVGKYGNLTLQADGSYSYAAQNTTLPEGAHASETFTYTISDGHGGTATADIVVDITGGNPPFGNNAPNVRGSIPASFVPEGTGDFDGNGTLDFLWRDSTTNAVELWTTAANGTLTKSSLGTVGANWTVEAVGNLDGKNGDDIVFRDTATGDVGAWIMRNGGQPSDWRALRKLDAKIDIAGAGDFDRNGTDDLLLVDGSTGAVDVWLQTASGPGTRSTVGTLPAGWAVAGIGDLDGNGTDDVLLFNAGTRALGAWQISNGKLGGWSDYGTLAAGWEVTEIGNFSGSGPDDIGFYNDTTGADGAWVMSPGRPGDWIAEPAHDDLDPIGAGRFASTTDQILWHNPNTGAVVTF